MSENRESLSHDDYERYEKQHQLMVSVIDEFDAERSTDSEELKMQRFERVLDIMQNMQALGHPPKDIVGDMVCWCY